MAGSALSARSAGPQQAAASPSAARAVAGPRMAPGRALGETRRVSAIVGAAWRADNTPISQAKLRLRNVVSGRLQAHAVADDLGQFAFQTIEPGSYVVELVTEDGSVLTVGHTFSVAAGETVATFVRLGTKVPWFNGFFGNAAAAVASTAAAAGVTAIAPEEVPCVSPPCRTGGSQ